MLSKSSSMPTITQGIDHPVIAVCDMKTAKDAYERLGFTVPPRGSHLKWGTGNWCIMFPHDYLELRGVLDPAKTTPHLQAILERGEGLMGTALATQDAEFAYEELYQRGFHPQPVRQLARNFELPEGIVQPRFSLCFLDSQETSGLMSVVFCQHLTPELLRRPQWLTHDNRSRGVHSLTCVVTDLDRAANNLERLVAPHLVSQEKDSLQIDFAGRGRIVVATKKGFERRYPDYEIDSNTKNDFLAVVSIAVDDIDSCKTLLKSRNVNLSASNDHSICIDPKEACGAMLEFVAPESA